MLLIIALLKRREFIISAWKGRVGAVRITERAYGVSGHDQHEVFGFDALEKLNRFRTRATLRENMDHRHSMTLRLRRSLQNARRSSLEPLGIVAPEHTTGCRNGGAAPALKERRSGRGDESSPSSNG